MSDLTPEQRLEKQRTLRDWLAWQLRQAEDAIAALERQVAEDKRKQQAARVAQMWKVQPNRAEPNQPLLHRGDCGLYKAAGYLSKEEVLLTAEQFPALQWCDICQPWGLLGIPKPGG